MVSEKRRSVLKVLGLGGVGIGTSVLMPRPSGAFTFNPAPTSEAAPRTEAATSTLEGWASDISAAVTPAPEIDGPTPWRLLAPYQVGSEVAGSRIVEVSPIRRGAVTVEFERKDATRFRVDICRRDDSLIGPTPIARTQRYAFFLANNGNGSTRTRRDEGLAAIALAWAAGENENSADRLSLMSMRERWASFEAAEVCVPA